MSRLIDNTIWNERSFSKLSVYQKLLYIYLETSPETNYYGVFKLPPDSVIEARVGFPNVGELLDELEKQEKIKIEGDYIILIDYFQKQKGSFNEKHKSGLAKFLDTLPSKINSLCIGYDI